MKEAFVFGTDKFELIRNRRMVYFPILPPPRSQPCRLSDHMVKIFNEKTNTWELYPCNETITECPVCGTLLKAYYIPGTSWMACCSKDCTKKLDEKIRELGSLNKAVEYFIKKRMEAKKNEN